MNTTQFALIALATALVAPLTASAAGETLMAPGYYETTTRIAGDPEVERKRECLTPAEVRARPLERVLTELTEGRCTYTQRQIGGGRFAFAGACVNEGVRTTFRNTGTYTPTSYSVNLNSRTMVGGTPIDIVVTTASRRIAAVCPAGAR